MAKEIVSQKDFGKEVGQIHEGLIKLRDAGMTHELWQRIVEDSNIAGRVVQLLRGEFVFGDWLDNILTQERQCHYDFFGKEFDLSEFEKTLRRYGQERIAEWQALGLEPHFLPKVPMASTNNYQGWKIKPEEWFYQKVTEGRILRNIHGELIKVELVELEGIKVLVDTRLKPQYNGGKQMYENDNLLGPIIEDLRRAGRIAKHEYGPQSSRFGVSAIEWEKQIKPVLSEKLGLGAGQLRLERAIEVNVISQLYPYTPRRSDGDTNTWVWYEEYFEDRVHRLRGGYSARGGLANIFFSSSDFHWCHGSFRPLAVL